MTSVSNVSVGGSKLPCGHDLIHICYASMARTIIDIRRSLVKSNIVEKIQQIQRHIGRTLQLITCDLNRLDYSSIGSVRQLAQNLSTTVR